MWYYDLNTIPHLWLTIKIYNEIDNRFLLTFLKETGCIESHEYESEETLWIVHRI